MARPKPSGSLSHLERAKNVIRGVNREVSSENGPSMIPAYVELRDGSFVDSRTATTDKAVRAQVKDLRALRRIEARIAETTQR